MELTLRKPRPARPGDVAAFTPTHPRVNLVPAAARQRAANRRARKTATLAWVATVALLATWWATGFLAARTAHQDLARAKAEGEALAVQMATYAPVTSIATQTKALNDTVASQTAKEIAHDKVLARFLSAVDGLMDVQSVQVSTTSTSGCVSTDPFTQVAIAGCITFTGTAPAGAADASQIITALGHDAWFADPFIPTVGAPTSKGAPISGTVGITADAAHDPSSATSTTEH